MAVKYRLYYTEESQLFNNFGKGNWTVPMTVERRYDQEEDEYVMSISDPQATRIEKNVEGRGWEEIYPKKKEDFTSKPIIYGTKGEMDTTGLEDLFRNPEGGDT